MPKPAPLPDRATLVATIVAAIEQVNGSGASWLSTQLTRVSPTDAGTAFALIARKLGATPIAMDVAGAPSPPQGWDTALVARLALLVHVTSHQPADVQRRLVQDLFYKGDTPERCAVLRTLWLLDEPENYALIATDGVRSHVQPVVEAIACENPYPALYLDDLAFNQLVMKAFFTGVPVHRISGLRQRLNADLRRMALDYAAERRAAGRSVPEDLELVTNLVTG
jgi:hypothetical protein